jgi:carnitine O-palmitoyltransferase 2
MRFRRSYIEQALEPVVFHLNPAKSDTKLYRNIMRLTPNAIATYVSFAFKAFPLDMSQYDSLFASTRIPYLNRDQLVKYQNSKHVAVIKNGQFYVFDVLDSNGDLRDPSDIMTCLKYIIDSPNIVNKDSITFLTTEDRDVWAKSRDQLISSSATNKENLGLIDSAQFVICLDEITYASDKHIEATHNFLHGCNKTNNYVNRWFDKSFSVIVTKDGHSAINFEHSWGDGVAVLRFFNEIFNDSVNKHNIHPNSPLNTNIDVSKEVKTLDFDLNNESKNLIKEAKNKFIKNTENLQLNYILYSKMNREYFKKKKLSPDSMFQLGFQMAYYRIYNSFAATYESCSTAAFKHGRTETVRSATTATRDASIAFMKKQKPTDSELRKLLDDCSKKHFQISKEAAMGQGFDRHLFVMKKIAEESGKALPEIYTDKSYISANHFILSTSTLYGEAFQGGGFAPVVPDGFGCAYGYVDNELGLIVSTYSPHKNGKQFIDAFRASLDDIHQVLEKC